MSNNINFSDQKIVNQLEDQVLLSKNQGQVTQELFMLLAQLVDTIIDHPCFKSLSYKEPVKIYVLEHIFNNVLFKLDLSSGNMFSQLTHMIHNYSNKYITKQQRNNYDRHNSI